MSTSKALPDTVDQLIDQLDQDFPEVVVSPGMTATDVFLEHGKRAVVHYLRQRQAWRDEEPL